MDITLVGFVIAVVSIILQLADAFPEHRETRKTIVVMSIGVFVGIVTSQTLGARYEVTGNVDRRFALLFVIAGLAAMFGIAALVVGDERRRTVALNLAGWSAGIFLATSLALGLGSIERSPSYSTDEILILADAAERRGQYELAIERLQELEMRLDGLEANSILDARIQRLQAAQVRGTGRP